MNTSLNISWLLLKPLIFQDLRSFYFHCPMPYQQLENSFLLKVKQREKEENKQRKSHSRKGQYYSESYQENYQKAI